MAIPPSAPATPGGCEWNLLLAASCVDPQPGELAHLRSLLLPNVDWEALLRLADEHGTSSLVYQNLLRVKDSVPSSVVARLRQRYQENLRKSLLLAGELICILDRLDPAGIAVIPYKGLVLSEVYYGDMALRQSGDI